MPKLQRELVKESLSVKIKKNKYNKLIAKKFIKSPKITNIENRPISKEIRIKGSKSISPKKLTKSITYTNSNPIKKK